MPDRRLPVPTWIRAAALALLALLALPTHAQQGQGASSTLIFELLNRLEQLEQEIRQLRGELELHRFQSEEQSRRIAALETHLGARTGTGSGMEVPDRGPTVADQPRMDVPGVPAAPEEPLSVVIPGTGSADPAPSLTSPPPSPLPAPVQPAPAAPGAEAQRDYDEAFGRLRDGQFEQAAVAFEAFLRRHPENALTPNALYWLGESHYVNREFDLARESFARLGAEFPRSDRVPDALLKLGYVAEHQDDGARAREIYQRLQESFPDHPAALDAASRLELLQ